MPALQNILVAVVGLTPQVITETVYYLTQVRQPLVVLSTMHIITTQRGLATTRHPEARRAHHAWPSGRKRA